MSRGKHLSLEEARKRGELDRFAKEHPMECDADRFARLLEAMASGKKSSKSETSTPDSAANSSGTQSRRDT